MLIDTHAHLYWDSYQEDLKQVIQRALDAGVTTIINVGVDLELSKKALEQAKGVLGNIHNLKTYSTIGIHPHEAIKYSGKGKAERVRLEEDINTLESIYRSNPEKVIAVGECGLDYFLDRNDIHPNASFPAEQIKDMQRKLFQAQISLAKKLNLPLIVHCRDDRSKDPANSEAWDEVLNLISDHPTILHCYSGLDKTTQRVLTMPNAYISCAATITYPKNEYLRNAVKILPLEKILLETDCPFLPPQSKRGQRNEPASILEIAQMIAQLKNITLEDIAQQTSKNVRIVFKL